MPFAPKRQNPNRAWPEIDARIFSVFGNRGIEIDVNRHRALFVQLIQHLLDHGGFAIAPGREDDEVDAVANIAQDLSDFALPVAEGFSGRLFTIDEWVAHIHLPKAGIIQLA